MKVSFRCHYYRWLKSLVLLFFLVLILMTIARLCFALYFGDLSQLLSHSYDFKKALLLGVRFDLMPLAYINFIPFLILNIGYFLENERNVLRIRFLIILNLFVGYALLGWIYVFDYSFYSYFQDHINVLFFGFFEDDTWALLISIYKNYNLFLWLGLILSIHYFGLKFLNFLFSHYDFDFKQRLSILKVFTFFFTGMVLLGFIGRGNFTRLPLSVEDAHISQNSFINDISLNGALTLNRAIKIRKTFGRDNFNYLKNYGFENWQNALKILKPEVNANNSIIESLIEQTKKDVFLKENPPHVVLVIMESFGSFWMDREDKEFQLLGDLKKYFDEGILFKNFLPAENGTIGSIVSVATAQVIRPGARFLSESEFLKTSLESSGSNAFNQAGYDTHFVYGGKLGWRNLGKFLKIQGFQNQWGADEIKIAMPELSNIPETDLGNEWGIFDEYLFSFIDEKLKTSQRPQFFLVLTTSNHPPFEFPSTYKPKPLILDKDKLSQITIDEKLAEKRFLGLQYSNQKVADFLSNLKNTSIGDKTIVALTGDHSFWIAKGVEKDQEFKRYAVPFFLSVPEKYRPTFIDVNKFGSHEDIFPTLINLSLSNISFLKIGEDLFRDDSFAINSSGLVANQYGAYHHGEFWKWKDLNKQILEPSLPTPQLEELKKKAKSIIALTDQYLKSEKMHKQSASKNDRP